MRNITAHEAKARFGQLLDAARIEPVMINKHGRGVAVVISKEEFEAMQEMKLQHLRMEVQKGLDDVKSGRYTEVDSADLTEFGDSIKARGRKHEAD